MKKNIETDYGAPEGKTYSHTLDYQFRKQVSWQTGYNPYYHIEDLLIKIIER